MGPTFGSRPIGWYQIHQMHAIDVIEEASKKELGYKAKRYRVKHGEVQALTDNGVFRNLGLSTGLVYDKADDRSRK